MTKKGLFAGCLMWLVGFSAFGQWVSENVSLVAGWNAVALMSQPGPADCETVFAGLPVEAIHQWDRSKGGVEFDTDPQHTVIRPPSWLVWRPASHSQAFLNDFYELEAGQVYLIQMAAPAVLNMTGRAVIIDPVWLPNEMNLVGLPVSGSTPPTFTEFFRHTPEIVNTFPDAEFYKILADGTEMKVFQPAIERMARGVAYWVGAGQLTEYAGPVRVSVDGGRSSVDFGSPLASQTLRIENTTDQSRLVTIRTVDSVAAPAGSAPVEGPVPISFEDVNWDSFSRSYLPLPVSISSNVPPRSVWELKLMPRVLEMTGGSPESVWQSVLKVSDAAGELEQRVGVSAKGNAETFEDPVGLWVGSVAVEKVSRMAAGDAVTWDPTEPVDSSDTFTFRVLLHVERNGTTRLMQRALLAWNPSGDVVVTGAGSYTNGTYALLADEADAESYVVSHPDAEIVRISSVNFPLMDPVELTGGFGVLQTLSGTVSLPFDDPVNPFMHRFAPLHDNLEYRNDKPVALAEGDESFTVERQVSFEFLEEDPISGAANPRWGVTVMGGIFREEVSGLNGPLGAADRVVVQGRFQVEKINDVSSIE